MNKIITTHFSTQVYFHFSRSPLPLHSRSSVTQIGCNVKALLRGTSTGLDLTSVLNQQLNARTKARLLTGCEHVTQRLALSQHKQC